jgi:hypothetical protein
MRHMYTVWIVQGGVGVYITETQDCYHRDSQPKAAPPGLSDLQSVSLRPAFPVHPPVRYAVYPWIATVIQG